MGKDPSAVELNVKGIGFMSEKRWSEAVTCLRQAVRHDPDNADYHENLGVALRRHGNDTEAARELRQAISLRHRSPKALAALGELMREHCNITGAAECFRKAFEMQPGTAWGLAQMAQALLEEGNVQSAAECAQLSISLDGSLAQAHTVLGSALQELGSFSEAQKALRQSVQLQSDQAEAYFKLAYGKKVEPNDRGLVESMQKVLDYGRSTLEEQRLLNYALGKAHEDLGEFKAAMQNYDLANQAALDLQMIKPFDKLSYKFETDRSIQTFTSRFFDQDARVGSPSETPILVIGMMRSGTTVLEQILGSHSKIGVAGETNFWMSKGAQAVRTILNSTSSPNPRQVAEDYLKMLNGLAGTKPYITDKDPLNFRYLGEIHFTFPRAKFIHCRRDPVDNCLSIYTTPYRVPADFSYSRENIVFAYKQYLRLMDHWRAALPAGVMLEVDYESIAQEPEATIREILRFLGLEWEEACLSPHANKGRIGTPSFWQARQPLYTSSIHRAERFAGLLGPFEHIQDG